MPLEVFIEFVEGMDFGTGFDSLSNQVVGTAIVQTQPTPVSEADAPSGAVLLTLVKSQHELVHAFSLPESLTSSVSIAVDTLKSQFLERTEFTPNSLVLAVHTFRKLALLELNDPQMQPAAAIMQTADPGKFRQAFGDAYVKGIRMGAEYCGVIRFGSPSVEDAERIAASIQNSGILGQVTLDMLANVSSVLRQVSPGQTLFVADFQRGGVQSPTTDALSVVANALSFAASFASGLEATANSLPCLALLQDYASLSPVSPTT